MKANPDLVAAMLANGATIGPSVNLFAFEESPAADREPKRKAKYGNHKTEFDGIVFDSKKEARHYLDLKVEQQAGYIHRLRTQVTFNLDVNGVYVCNYVADFTYERDGLLVVEDVKSAATRKEKAYRIKIKLMKAIYGIDVIEI